MIQKNKRKKPRLNHRYRFHLVHEWLVSNFQPCKAADIGGGKGMLAFLLKQSGWDTTVIDPFDQDLPKTFKNLHKMRTTLTDVEQKSIKRVNASFEEVMAADYDMLLGLHAHGSNIKIINAAKKFNKSFVLLPCCIIDEPINISTGVNWIELLFSYAKRNGFDVKTAKLGFKGQDMIIYAKAMI